jgi:hypothetical protein
VRSWEFDEEKRCRAIRENDKRVEKYEKVRENCQVIDAQCAAVEDVLQLIRDQSVTMRDPQQLRTSERIRGHSGLASRKQSLGTHHRRVPRIFSRVLSDHLDTLPRDVEQTEETVREVEAIFEATPLATGEFDAPPSTRNRIRS